MLILIAIGFVAGIVTALSPCVLPVLPIVLAGGATGRRPLAIVAGIVVSFTVFTLFAAWLLDLLGLPQDVLRNLAIGLLLLVALSLLVPKAGELLARPLQVLTRRGSGDHGGGFWLGASLGLVFVPCAGPVLAAVTVIAAKREVGLDGVLLTLAYALGAALPMLAIAFAGQRAARAFRARAENVRRVAGVLVAAAALAIAFGVDQSLQTRIPGYTASLQERFERSPTAQRELRNLTGSHAPQPRANGEGALTDYGKAPEFNRLGAWINSEPLTLAGLRGHVVLIDFWTYSCINCLRTLPYIREWDARYRKAGLTIVGVHSPEFAFERVESNVRENVKKLKLRYPVALDNEYGTWSAWSNQYWPAKYLIDRSGHVRYYHFGEGEYGKTEEAIRSLLGADAPAASGLEDRSPHGQVTPETYLGYKRLDRNAGEEAVEDKPHAYTLPRGLLANELAFGGIWTVEDERAVAGLSASLRLQYRARNVYLVLTGRGSVRVLVDGKPERTVEVAADRLYTLAERQQIGDHLLELRFSPGIAGYAFTFG
ncbi:MAG TPA: cytochrome c biogenesis protein DipZ [Gaiellaceae bacterium]|nr:cytochrome c biogenesis protein DipZ [Gaiellaceae bacterium]